MMLLVHIAKRYRIRQKLVEVFRTAGADFLIESDRQLCDFSVGLDFGRMLVLNRSSLFRARFELTVGSVSLVILKAHGYLSSGRNWLESRDPIIRFLRAEVGSRIGGRDEENYSRSCQYSEPARETLWRAGRRRAGRALRDDSVPKLRLSRDGCVLRKGLWCTGARGRNEAGRDSGRAKSETGKADAPRRNRTGAACSSPKDHRADRERAIRRGLEVGAGQDDAGGKDAGR